MKLLVIDPVAVIPAKAGIQLCRSLKLDSGFRRNDAVE